MTARRTWPCASNTPVAGDHISTERDYERLVQWISQQDKPVFIMPTYTAMLELREAVIRRCGGDEFWSLRRRKHGTEDLSFVPLTS